MPSPVLALIKQILLQNPQVDDYRRFLSISPGQPSALSLSPFLWPTLASHQQEALIESTEGHYQTYLQTLQQETMPSTVQLLKIIKFMQDMQEQYREEKIIMSLEILGDERQYIDLLKRVKARIKASIAQVYQEKEHEPTEDDLYQAIHFDLGLMAEELWNGNEIGKILKGAIVYHVAQHLKDEINRENIYIDFKSIVNDQGEYESRISQWFEYGLTNAFFGHIARHIIDNLFIETTCNAQNSHSTLIQKLCENNVEIFENPYPPLAYDPTQTPEAMAVKVRQLHPNPSARMDDKHSKSIELTLKYSYALARIEAVKNHCGLMTHLYETKRLTHNKNLTDIILLNSMMIDLLDQAVRLHDRMTDVFQNEKQFDHKAVQKDLDRILNLCIHINKLMHISNELLIGYRYKDHDAFLKQVDEILESLNTQDKQLRGLFSLRTSPLQQLVEGLRMQIQAQVEKPQHTGIPYHLGYRSKSSTSSSSLSSGPSTPPSGSGSKPSPKSDNSTV